MNIREDQQHALHSWNKWQGSTLRQWSAHLPRSEEILSLKLGSSLSGVRFLFRAVVAIGYFVRLPNGNSVPWPKLFRIRACTQSSKHLFPPLPTANPPHHPNPLSTNIFQCMSAHTYINTFTGHCGHPPPGRHPHPPGHRCAALRLAIDFHPQCSGYFPLPCREGRDSINVFTIPYTDPLWCSHTQHPSQVGTSTPDPDDHTLTTSTLETLRRWIERRETHTETFAIWWYQWGMSFDCEWLKGVYCENAISVSRNETNHWRKNCNFTDFGLLGYSIHFVTGNYYLYRNTFLK